MFEIIDGAFINILWVTVTVAFVCFAKQRGILLNRPHFVDKSSLNIVGVIKLDLWIMEWKVHDKVTYCYS